MGSLRPTNKMGALINRLKLNKEKLMKKTKMSMGPKFALLAVLLPLFLTSCTAFQHPAFRKNADDRGANFEPVRSPVVQQTDRDEAVEQKIESATSVQQTPSISPDKIDTQIQGGLAEPRLQGDEIRVNYHNLPLPAFINEVFGEQLKLSYSLDPELAKQTDLVTLRITQALSPLELYRVAKNTLETYGVVMQTTDDLISFTIDKNKTGGAPPLLVSGRALPDVPDSQRPIFMFVPLEVVSNTKVKSWLESVLQGQSISVREDPIRNAIVLQGKPAQVEQALTIIKSLDQPLMRGKYSVSIEPSFMPAEELAINLEKILQSEGYDASRQPPLGSVILLPLKGSNSLIVFAPNQKTLNHVKDWALTIDRKQQLSIDQGIFSYEVANARADHVVEMLNQLESGGASTAISNTAPVGDLGTNSKLERKALGRFVVDDNRNAILFQGSGQQWLELLPVIKLMDKAAPSVLLEVLIAEVTLNDQDVTGLEWLAKGSVDIDGRTFVSRASTLGGLGVGGKGFNLTLDRAGETRAVLNAFYENKKAEIRSRPRIMVKSGQTASIDVGDEIPIISSESRSVTDGDSPLVRNVQYRKTGLNLTIKPVIHASGYVDVEIDQTLSSAVATDTSGIDSPTIFNRHLQTVVTLKDGGSILLGGLVSSTGGSTTRGVPVLGKVPGLGKLFRTDSETEDRTELMVLVIPYVLKDPVESSEFLKLLPEPVF